jgi:hypothetical protein
MDILTIQKAKDYLDKLFEALPPRESGEECLNDIEKNIRQQDEHSQIAIIKAFGQWLKDENWVKIDYAVALIKRFSATEYIQELEVIRNEINAGISRLPREDLDFVKFVIKQLKAVNKNR